MTSYSDESHQDGLTLSVGDFVAFLNQTLETVYPLVTIEGELSNFRVSKGSWIYFDLKDELASLKFFGTVYNLPGPLEDGMMLRVRGQPRLHPLYGFSVTVQTIQPVGEGSLKRAADLLAAKLQAEGLFDPSRKRQLPYPPTRIGLITSAQSAAYADFVKVLNARWGGIEIELADVQVQGEPAVQQIFDAIDYFGQQSRPPEVLVITRGGGSAEDLSAFNTELLVRAVAASRVPTLLAIGHEVDVSLAELAADTRASTPSNAAELLVPDRRDELARIGSLEAQLTTDLRTFLRLKKSELTEISSKMHTTLHNIFTHAKQGIVSRNELLSALSPKAILGRGYSIARLNGRVIKSAAMIQAGQNFELEISDGIIDARANGVKLKPS